MEKLEGKLSLSLLFLRWSVTLVMGLWIVDKFLRIDHAFKVFKKYYGIDFIGVEAMYTIAILQAIVVISFFLGFKKKISYGLVFLMHLGSTLSTYKQMLAAYEGVNLLFFTAWPMLAAIFALYNLRDYDTKLVIEK